MPNKFDDPKTRREYLRKWVLEHPDKVKSYAEKRKERWGDKDRETKRKYYHKNKDRVKAYFKEWRKNNPQEIFRGYIKSAKTRGLVFDLTPDQFLDFWGLPCKYCGSPIETIGIDRVDNGVGYVIGNLAPCCKTCNYSKGTMSESEFISMCKMVAKNNGGI